MAESRRPFILKTNRSISMLSIRTHLAAFKREMRRKRRAMELAEAIALTKTAKDCQANTEKRIKRKLDRPTPFTQRGVAIVPARSGRLKSTVYIRRIQATYLERQETGGRVTPKRRALLTPAGARLNKYGNLSRGQVRRLLARPDTFSGRINATSGIWQRKRRGGVKLLIAYDEEWTYRPRLGFKSGNKKTALARFPVHHRREMQKSMDRLNR